MEGLWVLRARRSVAIDEIQVHQVFPGRQMGPLKLGARRIAMERYLLVLIFYCILRHVLMPPHFILQMPQTVDAVVVTAEAAEVSSLP